MMEAGERLPLAPETREDELRIHPRPSELDRNPGSVLVVVSFRQKDRPHAAAPELSHQSVWTHPGRRGLVSARSMKFFERDVDALLNESAGGCIVAGKERQHFAPHDF